MNTKTATQADRKRSRQSEMEALRRGCEEDWANNAAIREAFPTPQSYSACVLAGAKRRAATIH